MRGQAQLKTKKKQGLERMFETAFLASFDKLYPWWDSKGQQPRSQFHTAQSERNGWVDVVATYTEKDGRNEKIAIEFKVCELPRSFSNAPNGATYDVGQIAWDFADLATYKIEFGYCIAIIHGGIPSMDGVTDKSVARSFHNALFVDAATQFHFGRPKGAARKYDIEKMRSILPVMKLDKPYYEKVSHPGNFVIVDKKNRLAVVGLYVPNPKRKRR